MGQCRRGTKTGSGQTMLSDGFNAEKAAGVTHMKKIRAARLLLPVFLLAAGCGKENRADDAPHEDPAPREVKEETVMEFVTDTDYSSITAETEFSVYSKEVEKISCDVTNHHPGKGFYIFQIPYIEHSDQGEWARLS